MASETYRTIDMHTAGEPVRIVVEGYPELPGATILDKRRTAKERFDHIRTRLMLEPRGHPEMYGVIPVKPSLPGAALAVLFTHNSGYSTMCGHATIAIGRWAVEHGLVPAVRPVTEFGLECPCGLVRVRAELDEAGVGQVTFDSVPAFVLALDRAVEVPGFGRVTLDIAFGGAFYAILPASRLGLRLRGGPVAALAAAGVAVTAAVRAAVPIRHPTEPDLSFLYGTILTDDAVPPEESWNVCVFGEGQVDRSPTGSGVTARMALDHAKGLLPPNRRRMFRSVTGGAFSGEIVQAGEGSVVVRVGGRAYYSGRSEFVVEGEDSLRDGFSAATFP